MKRSIYRRMTAMLALPVLLACASSCADRVKISTGFPPADLVRAKPEPVPSPSDMISQTAIELFNNRHDAWAREGWSRIGRICRDAERKGALYPDKWCPPKPVLE